MNFWQSIDTPDQIQVQPSYLLPSGAIQVATDPVTVDNIFATIVDEEAAGYSKATKARMNGRKLMDVGWSPRYNIRSGLERTIDILREVGGSGFVSH